MYAIRSYYGFLAPTMMINRDYFGKLSPTKITSVITSYSIHYTKLYEPDHHPG